MTHHNDRYGPASLGAEITKGEAGDGGTAVDTEVKIGSKNGDGGDELKFRRRLGLTMVPGLHIVNVSLEERQLPL